MARIKADLKLVEYIKHRRDNTDEEILKIGAITKDEIKRHRKTCRALSNMRVVATSEIAASFLGILIAFQQMIKNGAIWTVPMLGIIGALGLYVYYNYLRLDYLDEGLSSLALHRVTPCDLKLAYKSKDKIGG